MGTVRQPSFIGGELAPALYAQSNLPRYASGLRRCRNHFITPEGMAPNRSGTSFELSVKTPAKATRLLPFIFSDTDSYVLEFGDLYVRFLKNGVQVLAAGVPYEVVTTYLAADLAKLKYAQVGDVVYLTCPGYDPRTLTRSADTSWALAVVDFSRLPPYFESAPLGIAAAEAMIQEDASLPAPHLPVADATHPAREWTYYLTAIGQHIVTGAFVESLPLRVTHSFAVGAPDIPHALPAGDLLTLFLDKAITLQWPDTAGLISQPAGWDQYYIVAWRVYRGRGTTRGYIGETSTRTFVDVGQGPDFLVQPPMARNPFKVFARSGALLRTEQPAAAAFFEQRLVFARTTERKGWLWLSSVGDFLNFDNPFPGADDDAIEFELASLRREEIRSLIGVERLFMLTSGGVWTLDGPVARTEIPQVTKHSDEGASWVAPLMIGDVLLYIRDKGTGINEVTFDVLRAKYGVGDLTVFARHFFRGVGRGLVEWAYAHDPYSVIWAIRQDGVLLSLTYNRANQISAWAWHDTEGVPGAPGGRDIGPGVGRFESVCAVPEGNEDAVYFVVNRTVGGQTKRYIERLNTREVTDARLGVFLDCAITVDGRNSNPAANALVSGDSFNAEDFVTVSIDSLPFLASDADGGAQVVIDPDGTAGGPFSMTITAYLDTFRVTAQLDQPLPLVFQSPSNTIHWGIARSTVPGVAHLEGKTVSALLDGKPAHDLVVTGGAVILPEPGLVVQLGLRIRPEVELLDVASPAAELKTVEKSVARVLVDVDNTRGLMVGETLDDLEEWDQREVADNYGPVPLETGTAEVVPGSSWNTGGRVFVVQNDPLPLTILGVTRKVEFGGG